MGTVSNVNAEEVPGGLFTLDHWIRISSDLLYVVMRAYPVKESIDKQDWWTTRVKPQTRQWAIEYTEYVEKQKKLAKERALAKLTLDDKIALGLEK